MFFAYLGSLDYSKSVGTNNLIKEFAQIVTSPEDILLKYGFIEKNDETLDAAENVEIKQANPKEYINIIQDIPKEHLGIYNLITKNPIDINEIVKKSNMDLKTVISKLTMLELEGKIKKIAGNRYIKGDE